MRRHSLVRWAVVVSTFVAAACGSTVLEEAGPQHFTEANIRPVAGSDKEIAAAVDAAVAVAEANKFRYDASAASGGRVIVTALWKDKPVTLTMGFFKKDGALHVASSMAQTNEVAADKGGEQLESLFYSQLADEADKRKIKIIGDAMSK